MCDLFGTGAANARAQQQASDAEAQTKALEAKRQADIKAGNTAIDSAFSKFDQPYYDNYKKTYTGAYNPEVDRQYGQAVDQVTSSLAGRGLSGSTYGNHEMSEVQRTRDDARSKIANDATNAASNLRGQVQQRKTDLFGLNQSAADPEGIAAQATGAATAIAAPSPTGDLGSLFQGVLKPLADFQTARQYAVPDYAPGRTTGRSYGII